MRDSDAAKGRWLRATIVLALLGATVGAALDGIHTHTGTTAYPDESIVFWRMAWWVPPLFAGAALAIGLSRPVWERVLERATPAPSAAIVAAGMGLFVAAYFLSGILPGPWSTRAMVLAVMGAGAWTLCDRSGLGVFLAATTAVLGTSVEIALVNAGAFSYLHPDLFGVAGWLPWLYVIAAIAVGNLGKKLVTEGSA